MMWEVKDSAVSAIRFVRSAAWYTLRDGGLAIGVVVPRLGALRTSLLFGARVGFMAYLLTVVALIEVGA